ncbi:MAG TPA: 5-(carboxyamino)imidazole ribonucleotide synthase [Planctomycetota bacterium]|nr:5-(carboxyamino)imidazole ribonucleotide synthase [Planctomycetota bacterium]
MQIGVLGGGQLGRMMALAGYPLGLKFRFLESVQDAPVDDLADRVTARYDDEAALTRFAGGLDIITYEFENVPASSAKFLARSHAFFPPPDVLDVAQDRLTQKNFFKKLGIPTAPFAQVDSRADLDAAVQQHGLPGILKTRRSGYDGKGQMLLKSADDVERAWKTLGNSPLIFEGFVPFEREVSIVAARSRTGETAFYPLVENHHREGILRLTLAPAPNLTKELQAEAERCARRIFDDFNYVGVLTIEMFQHGGRLLVNEMATRVHNSGHWSIEGSETSQFENHLRAGLGLPLGLSHALHPSAMINLIGTTPPSEKILAIPGAHLHLYGKSAAPGRKLGHVTIVEPDTARLMEKVRQVQALL